MRLLTRVARAAVPAAGLLALLMLQVHPARLAGATPVRARVVVFSDQARRLLLLQYQSYPTEFLGCMIGVVHGDTVIVHRIAPADVNPGESTPTSVVPRQTCEDAGWANTVGMIHSHPGGQRCFYYFPGTQVATSDGRSFALQPYPVDAIMCGDRIVWIGRDLVEQQQPLSLPAASTTTGAIPAPPIEGAGFSLTPASSHGAPAAPSRFRYVVEHQPTARVRTLAEPAGIAAREQLRR